MHIYACTSISTCTCTSVFLLAALLFIFWFARQFITSIIILYTHGTFLYGKMQVLHYVESHLASVRARHKRQLRGLIFQIATANKQLINWQIKIAVKINRDKKSLWPTGSSNWNMTVNQPSTYLSLRAWWKIYSRADYWQKWNINESSNHW